MGLARRQPLTLLMRLTRPSVSQIASMYGEEVAREAIHRSSSNCSMDEKAALAKAMGNSSGQSTGIRDVPTATYRPSAAQREDSEDHVSK